MSTLIPPSPTEKIRTLKQALDAAIRWIEPPYSGPLKSNKELAEMEKDNTIDERYKADIHAIRHGLEVTE